MTTKLVRDGSMLPYTATGNGTAGNLQVVGATLCHIPVSFTTGDGVELHVEGVFTATKIAEASSGMANGAIAYYRVTGGVPKITGVSAGGTVAGTCWQATAAATGDTTVAIKLPGKAVGV
jgi:predicted RecA/RadA family phage recombinase